MSGIDTAMPDVRNSWSYHANWNQNDTRWDEDFREIAGCGFDLLRWQMPWSLAEPRRGVYRWDLIDPKVELAVRLGIEIFYPITHFNLPTWIKGPRDRHAVFSDALPDALAQWTDQILSRYHFRFVIPVVEVQMEAWLRARKGKWQPHLRTEASYQRAYQNLSRAFRASAKVAKAHGATVFCSEPADALETAMELGDCYDIAGIDLYPHVHRAQSILGYLRDWFTHTQKPLCISEFGIPESYNPRTGEDRFKHFVAPGRDNNRVEQARELRRALQAARNEGIQVPFGGWYPGTGNIGWGQALTQDRSRFDCDRAGLVDLARQSDGSLRRVLCRTLVHEVLGLRDLGRIVEPAELMPAAYDGDLNQHELTDSAHNQGEPCEPSV